jgi:hypothetical protein
MLRDIAIYLTWLALPAIFIIDAALKLICQNNPKLLIFRKCFRVFAFLIIALWAIIIGFMVFKGA